MSISAVIQDEKGNNISGVVRDTRDALSLCLPELTDTSYCCVRFIDPYGDTIFNPLQARVLLDEWDRLKPIFAERDEELLWNDIRELIVRCSEEPHTYLRFIGD